MGGGGGIAAAPILCVGVSQARRVKYNLGIVGELVLKVFVLFTGEDGRWAAAAEAAVAVAATQNSSGAAIVRVAAVVLPNSSGAAIARVAVVAAAIPNSSGVQVPTCHDIMCQALLKSGQFAASTVAMSWEDYSAISFKKFLFLAKKFRYRFLGQNKG